MPDIKVYHVGDPVKLTAVFRPAPGAAPHDPTTVALEVTKPSGQVLQYTYNPGAIVRDSQGNYRLAPDLVVDQSGAWYYRWISTGVGQAAEPGQFTVLPLEG